MLDGKGTCRVLEVGAGNGAFSGTIIATAKTTVVTEMGASSAAELHWKYPHNA